MSEKDNNDNEQTAEEKALAAQGATKDNLDDGSNGDGAPKAPKAQTNKPPKEELDEEHGDGKDGKKPDDKKPEPTAEEKAAAEAAAAKQKEEEEEKAGPLKDFVEIEDPAGKAAINLLKKAGLGPNAANKFFAKALETGKLEDIDVAGLEARIGKDEAALVMTGVSAYYTGLASKAAATVKQTHDIFGGEDNWKTVREWAQKTEKADAKVKAKVMEIRGMLDKGGATAEAGARELLRMYNADPATTGLGSKKLVVSTGTGTVIGTPLSRADYVTELEKAHARGAKPAEIKSLDARRLAGKKQGI